VQQCIRINSETGGKLAHLAIVGREMGLTLYMLPNAKQLLPNGCNVNLSTSRDIISILDMQGDELTRIFKAKLCGIHYN
tara:strand:- start:851 stop:1087 length:237 start_codon:yes stop_codon:yes gene_type:complete